MLGLPISGDGQDSVLRSVLGFLSRNRRRLTIIQERSLGRNDDDNNNDDRNGDDTTTATAIATANNERKRKSQGALGC